MSILSLFLSAVIQFGSPVNYPISLAGNFGEPRPNHFHGGIDVRTGQVEGKPIFSIGDGYVSKVTVGLYGFGNAVYVNHPGGYTSVFCHLKRFSPQLAALVRRWQYRHQTYAAEIAFKPYEYPVAQGQLIAVSGNTGSSQAPHLHLELHDTRTWAMLDPLEFLKKYVSDTTKPVAHAFMAYPQEGQGVFCGGASKQSFPFTGHDLTREFTAWGKIGFGIWANDYMEGAYNRYGIRNTKLTVDDKVVFEADVDKIPMTCNRMVNSWGDYIHYCRYNVWYMKSFVEPGNTLPVLYGVSRGIIDFNEERPYHMAYILTDVFGNQQRYTFVVRGRKQPIPGKFRRVIFRMLRWDRVNDFQIPGAHLYLRRQMLPDNVVLVPRVRKQASGLSDVYTFYNSSYPLFGWAQLSLRLNRKVKDTTKLYLICRNGYDRFNGGTFKDGWVTGRVRELGAEYMIGYDEEEPEINPVSLSGDILTLGIADRKTGVRTYRGYIDGRFVLFENVPKSPWVRCDLRNTPVVRTGEMRQLKFVAVDNCGNQRTYITQIRY